jgi:7-cyano-7-deazaguanine reductase
MADETIIRGNSTGGKTEYVTKYRPSLLSALPRKSQRQALGITEDDLPFRGMDIWNAYEFTWVNSKGKPEVAIAQFMVPAKSASFIESRSLKLYLGSYSQTKFGHRSEVISTLESDLSLSAQAPVSVSLIAPEHAVSNGLSTLQGTNLDTLDIEMKEYFWDPEYLEIESSTIVRETLCTNLFKSLCPITGQPDFASVQIQYSGQSISHAGLLKYLVSYRSHEEMAEQITERIFIDIMNRCSPDRLSVNSFFNRRGGIDINPFRAHEGAPAADLRLWRQ